MSFTDANTGTAVGLEGTILRTTDGGTTWVTEYTTTFSSPAAVSFVDVNNAFVVGEDGGG